MRFRAPVIAVTAIVSLAGLAACGGSGNSNDTSPGGPIDSNSLGATGNGTDPNAKGPVTIDGATKGGTVTVLTNTGLTTTIDPTEIYYTDTSSIMSGLVLRSLTQYKYDPSTGQMILVPDLATDLGQHNADYTQWKFTIRTGIKYENGDPVTPQDILFGIKRSFDRNTFPTGADYSNQYFKGGDTYGGPYSDPNGKFTAASVKGNVLTINMSKPFPDMPYWGAFPAMGPVPQGSASDPKTYLNHPLATGPYKIKSYTQGKTLQLVQNPMWDPASDPARTQYPDAYDFEAGQDSSKLDQVVMGDTGAGQTTLTYDNLLAADYNTMEKSAPDRIVTGGQPCTFYWAPDYRKITDIRIRQALAWAYPYKDAILAAGEIPGVTAIAATNLMPPGLPGRTEYNVLGQQPFQTDPAKAKDLLTQANAVGYEIKFLFASDDPIGVKGKDVIVKALTAAGFKATPVATTIANLAADRADTKKDINLRSAGWCSDWPAGSSWIPPVLGSTNPDKTGSFGSNLSAFSEPSVDKQITAIQNMPLAQQPDAWNALDKDIATKYFPLINRWYGGVVMAHGSKIMGMNDDTAFGLPTWKDMWVSQ